MWQPMHACFCFQVWIGKLLWQQCACFLIWLPCLVECLMVGLCVSKFDALDFWNCSINGVPPRSQLPEGGLTTGQCKTLSKGKSVHRFGLFVLLSMSLMINFPQHVHQHCLSFPWISGMSCILSLFRVLRPQNWKFHSGVWPIFMIICSCLRMVSRCTLANWSPKPMGILLMKHSGLWRASSPEKKWNQATA